MTGVYDALETDFALPRQEKVDLEGRGRGDDRRPALLSDRLSRGHRYPLVVQLHGGPTESDKFGFGPGFIFNYVPVLAAKGYAVFRPNYRGSTGYGSAFVRDIVGDYFRNMHLDVLAGVDALIKQGSPIPIGWP